jgi:hypothetical protein
LQILVVAPAVYVFAGQQLELAFDTITSPEFIKKSLGIVIALVSVHVMLLVLLLRIQFKPRAITPAYIESVRQSTAFNEIYNYIVGAEKGMDLSSGEALDHIVPSNISKLTVTTDACKEMFAHRAKKLGRNRISRVKGWPFRLQKHKIVSSMKIMSRFNDWNQRAGDNFCLSATDLRGAHVGLAGPDGVGRGPGVALGAVAAAIGALPVYAALRPLSTESAQTSAHDGPRSHGPDRGGHVE